MAGAGTGAGTGHQEGNGGPTVGKKKLAPGQKLGQTCASITLRPRAVFVTVAKRRPELP